LCTVCHGTGDAVDISTPQSEAAALRDQDACRPTRKLKTKIFAVQA